MSRVRTRRDEPPVHGAMMIRAKREAVIRSVVLGFFPRDAE